MSDDQELAKALSGINDDVEQPVEQPAEPVITSMVPPTQLLSDEPEVDDASAMQPNLTADLPQPEEVPVLDTPMTTPPTLDTPVVSQPSGDLDGIKKEAILELRPLVDKLTLEPGEKFDTYLLLLRSTDDKELIAPAHEAAKAIPDETKRAEALLEIIKEIDFLNQGAQ